MTGWALGRCAGGRGGDFAYAPVRGRGPRHSWGRGRGFGPGPAWTVDDFDPESTEVLAPERQRTVLKADRNRLKALLADVEARLAKLSDNQEPKAE